VDGQPIHHDLSGNETAVQLRQYLDVARRRILVIILPAVAVFVATAIVAARLPNIYRAETIIMVDPQQVPNNYVASTVTSSIADRLSTIQQQVLSPSRLQKVIDSMGLYSEQKGRRSQEDIIRGMQSSISVEVVNGGERGTSTFRIAFHGPRRNEVAPVANQIAAMFINENLKVREQQSEGTAEFLDHELQETKKELEKKETEVQSVKTRNIMDLPDSKQYHLEVLGNLRAQLQSSMDRVNREQQEKVYLQSALITSHPTIDLDTGASGASSSPRQTEVQKFEARLAELQARYGPNHPDVRRAKKELDELKKKDAAEAAKMGSQPQQPEISPEELAAEARKNPVIESRLSKLNDDIQEQTKLQAQLQQQIDFHVSKLQQMPIFEQQMAGLMRDYDTLRAHYVSLLDKKISAEMASALETRQKAERFVILDAATTPIKPFLPNRPLICLAGLFGGFLAGIALAAIFEMGDESVRSDVEAARIAGKPVLAGIPDLLTNQQRHARRFRAFGAISGTVAGSFVLGFAIAKIAALFF
jgi:succinoglycan biosynthesis transport protein ExoP